MKIRKNIALSDSGFLFNPTTGDSFSVNPIGHLIIKMFENGKSEKEIIDSILKDYMTDQGTVEKDLDDFKVMLKRQKLIE